MLLAASPVAHRSAGRDGCDPPEEVAVKIRLAGAVAAVAIAAAACGGSNAQPSHPAQPVATMPTKAQHSTHSQPSATPVPHQSPVAPEVNPPGDIPDDTQFVPYT